MKVPLYTKEGKKKQEVVLNPEVFEVRINRRLLELVRDAYSANLRRGTANTKTRGEVRGGGKKPWKQKGTGNARHGSTRSPIWKGGGVVFGPRPRDYSVDLSKTIRGKALQIAVAMRGREKNIMLLESLKLATAKTKEWADIVKTLPLQGKKAVYLTKDLDVNLKRASRNLQKWVCVKSVSDVNAYDILQHVKVIIDESALEPLEKRLMAGVSKS
ncbi:MAG TPA: 50S ribosomal protein L4 [Candidatus Omnitrophota bacterium]|nr:50S ribosomal protein L4 [Candidatus Omnitrophota bacterium]HQB12073.1 50S ribosomal protein L4 [Candidatus Omnitrophota bacterium]